MIKPYYVTLISTVGPYMLFGYCKLEQMRDWLIEQKKKVNDDLISDFCRLIQGIAKEMEC